MFHGIIYIILCGLNQMLDQFIIKIWGGWTGILIMMMKKISIETDTLNPPPILPLAGL